MKHKKLTLWVLALTVFSLHSFLLGAEQKDPTDALPTPKVVSEQIIEGRKVIRYEHASRTQWGYESEQKDYFNLLPAKADIVNAPLRVILHSAGGSADKALDFAFKNKGWFHFYEGDDYHVLYLDCRRNRAKDWWWGSEEIKRSPGKYQNKLTPVEARVLSTIEWVARQYNVDRNRIYLSGISMGGSGSLGIGLCRGDIFAAISVAVPAGVEHMEFRMTNGGHPDPPPLFNFSSHIDEWSKGQERLLDYFEKNKYSLFFAWGTFGHSSDVKAAHPGGYKFPWLSIRKDQAYPVFTRTSMNDRYPGFMNKTAPDQNGQVNGYFRWKNVADAENEFIMELRLTKAEALGTSLILPSQARTDVTLRRTQKFHISSGSTFQWSLSSNGTVLQSGTVQANNDDMLTIEKLKISNSISQLRVIRNI